MSVVSLADKVFFTGGENVRSLGSEGKYRMMWAGVFIYYDGGEYKTDPDAIAEAFYSGSFDHNNIFGSYRIAFLNEQTGDISVWGDNCGSTGFFYDADSGVFSDSFLFLARRREKAEPCKEAVAFIFSHAPQLYGLTPVENILYTDPDSRYVIKAGGKPEKLSKQLLPLDSENYIVDYKEIIENLVAALDGEKYAAVCTGGTDSRVVIAALKASGGDPVLVMTGDPNHIDVKLAEEVAGRLGKPITVIDSNQREEGWISRAFDFSDGCFDTVAIYRHMKKTLVEQENGIKYEFGGFGGEHFKSYYYKKGRGVPSPRAIAHDMYQTSNIPEWLGNDLRPYTEKIYERMVPVLSKCCRAGRVIAYNDVGRVVARTAMIELTSPISRSVIKIDPLCEPRVMAGALNIDPDSVDLHIWHRQQIKKYAPELIDIPTDQGYNFSLDKAMIKADIRHARRVNTVLWVKRTGKKLSRRLAHHSRSAWNVDYEQALNSPEFAEALRVCKAKGFINESVTAEQITPLDVGVIIRVGLIFSEKYGLAKKQ